MHPLYLMGFLLIQAGVPSSTTNLKGRVVYIDGTPAAYLNVTAFAAPEAGKSISGTGLRTVRTDESGQFQIPSLSAGRYVIRAGVPGDVIAFYPGVAAAPEATVVTVGDANTEPLTFSLPASFNGVRGSGKVVFPRH